MQGTGERIPAGRMLPYLVKKPGNGGYEFNLGRHLLKPLERCQVHELVLHDCSCRQLTPKIDIKTLAPAGKQVLTAGCCPACHSYCGFLVLQVHCIQRMIRTEQQMSAASAVMQSCAVHMQSKVQANQTRV